MQTLSRSLLLILLLLFCMVYPIAVIGVAFNVVPPFSAAWAASALLFLEGSLLIIAACLVYNWRRVLLAAIGVIVLAYLVETLGVNSGFPFGIYTYTNNLLPQLPGNVPLPVMFAWVLVVFGSYSLLLRNRGRWRLIIAALLATLLDLAIEPVAASVVHYWEWSAPGVLNYYGVPFANFVAWFVVALLLLLLLDRLVSKQWQHGTGIIAPVALLTPRFVFAGTLLMFGLVDLTHGYYWGTLLALTAGIIIAKIWLPSKERDDDFV